MPCDTKLRRGQTLTQRKEEIKKTVTETINSLISGRVKPKVSPTGAIAFTLTDSERNGATDACIYRMIMTSGSTSAKLAIARAEQLAGKPVSRAAITAGIHSHDGGTTWHEGH